MIDDDLLLTAVHDTAVRRLQHAYADVCNRRAWAEMPALFRDDAEVAIDVRSGEPIRLVGGAAVGQFIGTSLERFEFFEFEILNAHIVFPDGPGAGTALARMFMCEHRQDVFNGHWTNAYGLYHDRYTFESGRWWFAARRYHSLARNARDADVLGLPEVPPFELGSFEG